MEFIMDFISNYFELIIIIFMVVVIWFLLTTRAAIITADDRHTAMMMYQSDRLEEISKSISGEDVVIKCFKNFLEGSVEKYLLPGSNSINFMLNDVLGGGGPASLRNDPQGKAYAQILLDQMIPIPANLLD